MRDAIVVGLAIVCFAAVTIVALMAIGGAFVQPECRKGASGASYLLEDWNLAVELVSRREI